MLNVRKSFVGDNVCRLISEPVEDTIRISCSVIIESVILGMFIEIDFDSMWVTVNKELSNA